MAARNCTTSTPCRSIRSASDGSGNSSAQSLPRSANSRSNWRSAMSKPEFVYVTYIKTTPEKLWQALTDSDFTERYWFGNRVTSDWTVGSTYRFAKQGKPGAEGKVLVLDPPKKLSYSWDLGKEGTYRDRPSRVTFVSEP